LERTGGGQIVTWLRVALAPLIVLAIAGCGSDEAAEPERTTGAGAQGEVEAGQVGEGSAVLEGEVKLELVADVPRPTYVDQPPGSELLFATEQPGKVRVIREGELLEKPFINLEELVNDEGSEQGLLSIAFAPDYKRSGRFYVAYTDNEDRVVVDEYRRDSNVRADLDSRRTLLSVFHKKPKHNGGLVVFGPDDHLYVGLGDGGPLLKPRRRAQNPKALLGKILRIDPRPGKDRPYSIPPDNPFVGKPGRDEIFAYGLRNPWRFAIDPEDTSLTIGDVGRFDHEEIDYVPSLDQARRLNFGWPAYEGFTVLRKRLVPEVPNPTPPIHTYMHDRGCSVIGGYEVRDPELPSLEGQYLYSDACTGELRSLRPVPGGARDDRSLGVTLPPEEGLFGLISFGDDEEGHIYAASHGGGVYRLTERR
jgi:glucose/arabinose dehydrogenase